MDNNKVAVRVFILVIIVSLYIIYSSKTPENTEVTEDEYYSSENYAKTGESYEQYKADKEFINDLYEATQNK